MRIFVLALVILVAACGETGTTTSVPTPTATPTPTDARAAAQNFSDVVHLGALSTYRIAYVYRVSSNGQTLTLESTWYVRPPEMRWDFISPLGGASSFYILKDGVFVCSAAGQPTPSCFAAGSGGAAQESTAAQVQQIIRDHPERFIARPVDPRVVAGIKAQCYAVRDVSAQYGQGTLCFSAGGLPLFSEFQMAGDGFSLEATSINSTVSEADLQLPAPIRKP
ncbi:MAG TPA: hypothetical protein VJQ09_09555 [Candidatus Limnocylindria bacterium]|nr:hypothetical protein [Candidatus Limnocylindria bacterium]